MKEIDTTSENVTNCFLDSGSAQIIESKSPPPLRLLTAPPAEARVSDPEAAACYDVFFDAHGTALPIAKGLSWIGIKRLAFSHAEAHYAGWYVRDRASGAELSLVEIASALDETEIELAR